MNQIVLGIQLTVDCGQWTVDRLHLLLTVIKKFSFFLLRESLIPLISNSIEDFIHLLLAEGLLFHWVCTGWFGGGSPSVTYFRSASSPQIFEK